MGFQYLDKERMELLCHKMAQEFFAKTGEPIPPFENHDAARLESALALPAATFDGKDLYRTLPEKAAVMFYSLCRNHPFLNGNKRIATTSLVVFLLINDYWLKVPVDEFVQKTIYVADSPTQERDAVIQNVVSWIEENILPTLRDTTGDAED